MSEDSRRFGTFGGVFTPCTLTILGVIMFLRYGQVVGQAGLIQAIFILLVAKSITLFTAFSLSAIATNTRVKGGGAYYLISRSLGVEFGGAIGVVFFLAQAISVAMYVIGFSEAVVFVFPALAESSTLVASLTNIAVFIMVFVGAGWAIKLQYGILAILAAAIVAFLLGAARVFDPEILSANLVSHYDGESAATMFALFFPAVTGIMAGANMSGDLKNPGRSIPKGTILAIVVTTLVYAVMAIALAGSRSAAELQADNQVVRSLSLSPLLVTAGVFCATLSSALGSMMGAPRIIQAFARDRVFRWLNFLGKGSGESGEPRRATFLTFCIAQACILVADLNAIAPVITMFFLITYGTLNLATFYESVVQNPSYRPRFRLSHWSTALLGFAGCLVVMFLLAPVWAAVSILLVVGIHWFIGFLEIEARWGDLRSGVLFERTRRSLSQLERELAHPKNWRPIILALSGASWSRVHLAVYGHWLAAGHGILSLGQVIQGDLDDGLERRAKQEQILRDFIRKQDLEAFPAVVCAPSVGAGIESLVQCHGLGSLRPNTVLIGWPRDESRAEQFPKILRQVGDLGRSLVVVRCVPEPENPLEVPHGTIDVWWRGKKNGALMIMLAHLLSKNDGWRTRRVRLLRVVANAEAEQDVRRHLDELIESARINATSQVVVSDEPIVAIQETSRYSAVVFLGMETPTVENEGSFYRDMEKLAGPLPRVIYAYSSGEVIVDS